MLFKIVNYAILGLAAFYVAEGVGLLERGRYFPTLPRLEASASDPMAWLGALTWGAGRLTQLASGGQAAAGPGRELSLNTFNSFTQRLDRQRAATQRMVSNYYGR